MSFFSKVTVCAYLGIIAYLLFNAILGPTGLVEYSKLEQLQERLSSHIVSLEEKEHFLSLDLKLIQDNEREIELRARELGYYKAGEGIIILEGGKRVLHNSTPGYIIDATVEPVAKSNIFLIFGFIVFFVSLFCVLILGKKNDSKKVTLESSSSTSYQYS